MEGELALLIPIFICVVLPVAVVWLKSYTQRNNDNKRAEILIKAIENNNGIDTDKLAEAMQPKQKPARELQLGRLQRGCIFTLLGVALSIPAIFQGDADLNFGMNIGAGICAAVGIGYLITYFVARRVYKE